MSVEVKMTSVQIGIFQWGGCFVPVTIVGQQIKEVIKDPYQTQFLAKEAAKEFAKENKSVRFFQQVVTTVLEKVESQNRSWCAVELYSQEIKILEEFKITPEENVASEEITEASAKEEHHQKMESSTSNDALKEAEKLAEGIAARKKYPFIQSLALRLFLNAHSGETTLAKKALSIPVTQPS